MTEREGHRYRLNDYHRGPRYEIQWLRQTSNKSRASVWVCVGMCLT